MVSDALLERHVIPPKSTPVPILEEENLRLARFSVKDYRSITQESTIDLDDYTVLVGRNNEGKTNLLRAIDLSLTAVGFSSGPYGPRGTVLARRAGYDWARDYPVGLQDKHPDGCSEFSLEYELTREESLELQDMLEIGIPRTYVLS